MISRVLDRLLKSISNLLHPTLYIHMLHRVGGTLASDLLRDLGNPSPNDVQHARKCFAQGIDRLNEWGTWDMRVAQGASDRLTVRIAKCPFVEKGERADPGLCQMEGALLGTLAGELFGYAKVETRIGPGSSSGDCRHFIYTNRSPAAIAAPGISFPDRPADHQDSLQGDRALPQFALLSAREREVLRLIGGGLSDKQIAETLGLSVRTVEGHAAHIRGKLDLQSRHSLITFVLRNRLN